MGPACRWTIISSRAATWTRTFWATGWTTRRTIGAGCAIATGSATFAARWTWTTGLSRFATLATAARSLLATGTLGTRSNHGQGNAGSFAINRENPNTNSITHRDELKWIAHKSIG
jgi:hypothetical protein